MIILAIDPGNRTGFARSDDTSGTVDITPRKGTKTRAPEPEIARLRRLVEWWTEATKDHPDAVVVEGAAAFVRGKAAVRVSHELRGAIKALCVLDAIEYVEVQPGDWKKLLFGRGDVQPPEYLARAQTHLCYRGESEDEAAALWLLEWAKRHVAAPSVQARAGGAA